MSDYEVNRHLIVAAAWNNEIGVANGWVDIVLIGLLHELIVLVQNSFDSSTPFLYVPRNPSAESYVV